MALSIVFITAFVYAYQNNFKLIGQQQKSIMSSNNNIVVARINGYEITKNTFDEYKLLSGNSRSDQELLNQIIERHLLYQEATKKNISISNEQIEKALQESKYTLNRAPELYKKMLQYWEGLGMTEDQYWEYTKPVYEKSLMCGEYKDQLKSNYKATSKIKDTKQLNDAFDQYFKDFIADLKKQSAIEIFIN